MQVRRTNETAAIEGGLTRYDALLLGMILVIGFNIPAVKWAIEQVDPYFFNAVRYSLATVASVASCLWK
jgi:ABC-type transport system involved in cytochrome c biogenesis permease subunit